MATEATMDETFEAAVEDGGQDYLKAEAALRAGGPPAIAVLQRHLKDKDGVTQLIARMILAWASGKAPEFQKALDLIDALGKAAKDSPAGEVGPLGLARALGAAVGAKAVDVLAVRLIKEGWPEWKALGVLTYLEQQGPAEAAPALVRYAAHARNEELRTVAMEVLAKVPPAVLTECLKDEKVYLEKRRKTLPPALEKMLAPPPPPTPPKP